jgi:ribosomal protein L3
MTIGLVGKKCGMTRVITEDGASIPVTVIEVLPNRITQDILQNLVLSQVMVFGNFVWMIKTKQN